MILNYTEPQLNIDQILSVEVPSVPRQSAVIVGTQYVSPGFESNFEYETFSDEGGNLELTFVDTDDVSKTVDPEGLVYKLDTNSVDVLVKDAEFDLFDDFDDENGINAYPYSGEAPNRVRTNRNLRVAGDGVLWSRLRGRPISIGDTVYCYNAEEGGDVQKRKVTGFIGRIIDSTFGTGTGMGGPPNSDTLFSGANSNPAATSTGEGTYVIDGYIAPASYETESITTTETGLNAIAASVNTNGTSIATDSSVNAGVQLNIRITSYNAEADTGVATLTSTDGIINTTVPFSHNSTTLTFNLASSSTGLNTVAFTFVAGVYAPALNQVFSVFIFTQYAPLDSMEINSGSSYFTGLKDNTFYLKVITGNYNGDTAVLQAYDALGNLLPNTIEIPYATDTPTTVNLGSGMQAVILNADVTDLPQNGFRKNDIYFINAVAEKKSTTEFRGLILDGPATASGEVENIKIRGTANGSVKANQASNNGFELNINGTSVDYFGNLTWFVPSRNVGYQYVPLLDGIGSAYLNWRAAAVPAETEGAIQISSYSDLTDLGPAVPGNDIAYAAKIANDRITGNTFYVLRTSGDTAEDITTALEKIENTDLTYALAIISEDPAAFLTGIEHAETMSAKNVKNFRRVYFGAKCPTEFTVVETDVDGATAQATVTSYSGLYRYVTFTSDVQLQTKEVRKGDILSIQGNRLIIEQVVSETELLITAASALNFEVNPAVSATVIKPNNALNQATFITNLAKAANSRRGALIWCDSPVTLDAAGNTIQLHPKFIAAEVAAIRSILAPQLGLSRTKISSVSEAPAMYAKYKRNVLNSIAANGVMIITQDNEGADVVIRHQLTTDSSNGNLYYEDSVGVNVDNLSFKLKDTLDKYVGRRNVTPSTLGIIRHDIFRILEDARTTSIADLEIGPQIINFYDEEGRASKVTVKAHPTFKDRIQVKVRVAIPLPMNVIEVEIEAVSEVVVSA